MSGHREDLRRLGGGGALLLASTLVGNALLLLLDIYQNGLLPQEAYGAWSTLRRSAALAGFVGLLGLENIVLREVASGRDEGILRSAAAQACAASLLLGAVLLAWAPIPANAYVGQAEIALVALSLPLAALRLLAVATSQGRGDVRSRSLVMFLAWPGVQLLLLPWLLSDLAPARAVALSYTASLGLGALLALALAVRADPRAIHARRHGPTLLRASWPLWLQGIGMAGYTWLDQLLLAALAGAHAAGAYGPVAALAPLYGLGLTALNGRFAPMIAAKHVAGDQPGLAALHRSVARLSTLLGGIPLAVTLGAAPTVLALWPGGDPTAAPALRITAAAWMGCTLVGSVNYLLIMAGHQRQTLTNAALGVVTSVALSCLLVPPLGVTGAALANAGAILAANGLGWWQVRRTLGMSALHGGLIPPLLAVLPAAVAAAGVAHLVIGPPLVRLLAVGVGGAAAYVAAAIPGLHPDDRYLLRSLRGRGAS